MRRTWVFRIAWMLLGAACMGAEGTNSARRLTLFLTDGSRLVGGGSMENLAFRAAFGKIEIPLGIIGSFEMGRDGETAVVQFRNDDRLTGIPLVESLPLQTAFGDFMVPLTTVKKFTVTGAASVPDAELLYGFDDQGEEVSDCSGKGRSGRPVGLEHRVDARGDRVASFAGASYVVAGGLPVSFDGDFTLAAWVCPASPPAREWEPMILSRWMQQPARGVRFSIRGPRDGANAGKLCLIGDTGDIVGLSDSRVEERVWHHVAVVYVQETQTASFYVDGRPDGASSRKGTVRSADCELTVGCASWAAGQSGFRGLMDDVLVCSRAMTEAEIRDHCGSKAARVGQPDTP